MTPAGTALYESAQAEVEETYRLLEAQFTTEKLQQLTSPAGGVYCAWRPCRARR